jgi:hypothetical protein
MNLTFDKILQCLSRRGSRQGVTISEFLRLTDNL